MAKNKHRNLVSKSVNSIAGHANINGQSRRILGLAAIAARAE
jgi:hypothetical protein